MRPGRVGLLMAVIACGTDVRAQDGAKPALISGSAYTLDGMPMYAQGAPFSLVEEVVTTNTMPDGSSRTSNQEVHAYRDATGRFRLESGAVKDGSFVARRITIFDPAALTSVSFSPTGHTARLTHVAPRKLLTEDEQQKLAEQAARSAEFRRTHPGSGSEEALGTKTIAGLVADGARRVLVFPGLGERRTETWTSRELGIPLEDSEDSAVIHRHRVVTQATIGPPDAALFIVPKDITLEEGPVAGGGSGGGLSAPAVLSTAEPQYSDQARRAHVGGNVLVGLRVDENGVPTNVHVIRGVGYGLDEKAVEAVKQYHFKPAMRNGKPVAVDMNVDVNFQIFGKP